MSENMLSGWMRALIGYVRSGQPDLTNRQMALMLLVYLTPGPHTVRGLARVLGVSKPVITRALNTLGGLGYLRRERDQLRTRVEALETQVKAQDTIEEEQERLVRERSEIRDRIESILSSLETLEE